MISDEKYSEFYLRAKHLFELNKNFVYIKEQLLVFGADESTSDEIISQLKKIHYANKRKRGSLIVLTGAILLLIGFVMTVSNFYANTSFAFVMYGFTSVGLLVIFIGLYDCFG